MTTSSDFAPGLLQLATQTAVSLTGVSAIKDVQNNGTTVDASIRSKLNFVNATSITDDSANDRVTITLPAAATIYRKTTAKTVNTTVAETDLLNGEITIAANAMGASSMMRIRLRGDWKQNSGGTAAPPEFKLKLGATTIFDTGVPSGTAVNAATRFPWAFDIDIANLGATNSQWASLVGWFGENVNSGTSSAFTTGTGVVWISVSGTTGQQQLQAGNSSAVDMTASQALVFSVINGSANAAYETKLYDALVVIE